jgi:hypothetical protein
MKATNLLIIFLLSICFVYAGCNSSEQKSDNPIEEVIEKTEEMHEEAEAEMDKNAPPKLAAELWGLINTEGYKEHWKMLPGKDAYYDGGDGKLITTYLNDIAFKAVENGEEMPPGSIVVSENYDLEKNLQSISVKASIPGFDDGEAGWFSVTYDPGGKPISYD